MRYLGWCLYVYGVGNNSVLRGVRQLTGNLDALGWVGIDVWGVNKHAGARALVEAVLGSICYEWSYLCLSSRIVATSRPAFFPLVSSCSCFVSTISYYSFHCMVKCSAVSCLQSNLVLSKHCY